MNINISIYVIYHLQTHIYKNKTDLNMRTILSKKRFKQACISMLSFTLLPPPQNLDDKKQYKSDATAHWHRTALFPPIAAIFKYACVPIQLYLQ